MDAATQEHYRVWQRLAPLGLLLVGAGASVIADAATRRGRRERAATWIGEGTVGLVVLNAGLSVFGEAVKRRALYDVATGSGSDRGPLLSAESVAPERAAHSPTGSGRGHQRPG